MRFTVLLMLWLLALPAAASYRGNIYTFSALTAANLNHQLCADYAAEHIRALGFTIARNDGFEVDAVRGEERVIYSCDFGTTYGGKGMLTIVYIPEGDDGFAVVGSWENWKKINSPQMVLYGMKLN